MKKWLTKWVIEASLTLWTQLMIFKYMPRILIQQQCPERVSADVQRQSAIVRYPMHQNSFCSNCQTSDATEFRSGAGLNLPRSLRGWGMENEHSTESKVLGGCEMKIDQ